MSGMLKGKKIGFVVERLAGRRGGAEKVVADLANGFSRRGAQVFILHHEWRTGGMEYDLESEIEVRNIFEKRSGTAARLGAAAARALSVFPSVKWSRRYAPFGKALGRFAAEHQPDAMIAVMPPAMGGLEMAQLPEHTLKVASNHNAPEQEYLNPERWDKGRYGMKRRLSMLKDFDKIGVLLPEYRDWYEPALRAKTTVTPNMIFPTPEELRARPELSRTIVAVGRLVPTKRLAILIEAFGRLKDRYPGWSLEIYGHGELEEDLRKSCQASGVGEDCLKGVSRDMPEVYRRAACLAHPSRFEGFPLVVGEALSAGLPVVGFEDCSGVNVMVRSGENGLLVPGHNDRVAAFADALETLMADEALRQRLGDAGPDSMAEFSPDAVLDLWGEFLFGQERDKS